VTEIVKPTSILGQLRTAKQSVLVEKFRIPRVWTDLFVCIPKQYVCCLLLCGEQKFG